MFRKIDLPTHLAVKVLVIVAVCLSGANLLGLGSLVIHPFQKADTFRANNTIDTIVMDALAKKNAEPANLCSDEVFIRRVYLDVTGTLPQVEEVKKFLKNPRADKRTSLIGTLLKQKEFSEYASLKWCDLLRVKAEFPINLWPNAVQAYHRWITIVFVLRVPRGIFHCA